MFYKSNKNCNDELFNSDDNYNNNNVYKHNNDNNYESQTLQLLKIIFFL